MHSKEKELVYDLYTTAVSYLESGDYSNAFNYFQQAVDQHQKAAAQNDPVAQRCLGQCFETGIGTVKNERVAFEYYQKAAARGDIVGLRLLGECYEYGIGTASDKSTAFKCYLGAAQSSNRAQKLLTQCNILMMAEIT